MASLALISLFVILAILGPGPFTPFNPNDQNLLERLHPPAALDESGYRHWLGTDGLGRDILARLIAGTRATYGVAALAVASGAVVGTALGLFSGYVRGWLGDSIMRLVELQMVFPFVFVAIAVTGLFGQGFSRVVIVLVTWSWVAYARIVRSSTLGLREREFVLAAGALGASESRIMLRHVLPHLLPLVMVIASTQFGRVVVAYAGLEFLGLGLPPPAPSWGGMLSDGRDYIVKAWWITTIPGLAITISVLAMSFIADAARKWLLREET